MSRTASLRSTLALWLVGSALVSVVVLVGVLHAGGGAPRASAGGLPDAGPLTGWGLPVVRLLVDLAGCVTVGLVLVGSRVIHVQPAAADDALPAAGRTAAIWAALATLQALLVVSETQATPLATTDLAALSRLLGALDESPDARAMLVQAALAASAVWFAGLSRGTAGAAVTLAVALAAFLPQTLVGHAATGDRLLGSASLALHVTAAALWVGGLAALAWAAVRGRVPLANAVPRYSLLALWCVGAVAVSGIVNAAVRIGSFDALSGGAYGVIVLAKVAALVVLAGFGWLHREHTVERLRAWRRRGRVPQAAPVFIALAATELVVMAATVALAVGLSRTPPPASVTGAQEPVGTRTAVSAFSAPGSAR